MKKYICCFLFLYFTLIFSQYTNASVVFTSDKPKFLSENIIELTVYNDNNPPSSITGYYIFVYKGEKLFSRSELRAINPYQTNTENINVPAFSDFIVYIFTNQYDSMFFETDRMYYTHSAINVECLSITNLENQKMKMNLINHGLNGNWKYIIKYNNGVIIESSIYNIADFSSTYINLYAIYPSILFEVEIYCYVNDLWLLTDKVTHKYQDPDDIIITDPIPPDLT